MTTFLKKLASTAALALLITQAHAVPLTLDMQLNGYATMFGNNSGPTADPVTMLNYIPVRNVQDPSPDADIQSVLRFDTTALSALAGPGQTVVINSAHLRLDFLGQGGDPTTTLLNAGLGTNDTFNASTPSSALWNQYSQLLGTNLFTTATPEGLIDINLPGLSFDDIGGDQLLSLLLFADENATDAFNELQFGAGPTDSGTTGALPRLILDVSIVNPGTVPEPGSLALVGLGLGAFALSRRRRR